MTDKPAPPRESWEGLTRRSEPASTAPPDHDTPEEMVMRVLSGGDGPNLIDWLRREYVDHCCRPAATEAEIREAEARRQLVRRLEAMRDRGVIIARERNKG